MDKRKKLFGTRGIRGPIATKVTPGLALRLGLALSAHTQQGKVVVGMDPRTSSEMLKHALVAGLLAGGSEVVDLGLTPSPCVAFTTRELKASAGVVITASHNPPPDNGFAFYRSTGMEFLTQEELELERLVLEGKPDLASWDRVGGARLLPGGLWNYLRAIQEAVEVEHGLKVVVDCANGAASLATPRLLRELGCKVTTLNSNPDGRFPGRPAEPQPWNLGDLMATVRELGADLGIAHDGDADRVAVVDERGRFVKHDTLIALFAREAVKARGGGRVVTSINTSVAIEEVVAQAGGKILRTSLGNIHEAMLEHRAIFAGEPGKLIFPEFGLWPDGLFTGAKVLELLSKTGKPLSKVVEEVPDYHFYHQDFPCPEELKHDLMRYIGQYLLEHVPEVRDVLDIDGIRVNRRNGSWLLIRVSGTEPKARMVLEGRTQAEAEELKQIGLEGIKRFRGGLIFKAMGKN